MCGNPENADAGLISIGMAPNERDESAIDRIPVNNRLCMVGLRGWPKVSSHHSGRHDGFVISGCASMDCTSRVIDNFTTSCKLGSYPGVIERRSLQ